MFEFHQSKAAALPQKRYIWHLAWSLADAEEKFRRGKLEENKSFSISPSSELKNNGQVQSFKLKWQNIDVRCDGPIKK